MIIYFLVTQSQILYLQLIHFLANESVQEDGLMKVTSTIWLTWGSTFLPWWQPVRG
jgi:hypothetical protein